MIDVLPTTLLSLLAKVTVILLGVGLILVTMLWPTFLCFYINKDGAAASYWVAFGLANAVHLYLLYTDSCHVFIHQFIWLPVRRLLAPLVMWVAKIESIREKTPTMYQLMKRDDDLTMSRNVRRRYRKMEQIFRESGLRHEAVSIDQSGVSFSQLLPILWEHQLRSCPNNVVEEFIKRFLVVALMPDGLFDLYYENRELVAFQFSMRQGPAVLHWFMYFCRTRCAQQGIWFHGIRLAMKRGQMIAAEPGNDNCFINAQVHQTQSKQNAGLETADHTNESLLSQLYPFSFSTAIPREVAQVKLWHE